MATINVSSDSDSDEHDVGELEVSQDTATSSRRKLPDWASEHTIGSGASKFDASGERNKIKGPSSNLRNVAHNRTEIRLSFSGTESNTLSSQQESKRILPISVSPYSTRSDCADKVRRSETRIVRKPAQDSGRLSLLHVVTNNGPGRIRREDELEINAKRRLPPSLAHGKKPLSSSSNSKCAQSSIMCSDEQVPGNDERLILRAALEDIYQPKTEADVPSGLLSVSLLRHQRIGLQWMLYRERRGLLCLGGILADDQSLGKTVSMIALIQVQKFLEPCSKSKSKSCKNPKPFILDDEDSTTSLVNEEDIEESASETIIAETSSSSRALYGRKPVAGTLIICPASVLRQWARELDEKVADESKLNVHIYHGSSRTKDPAELAAYDVVLTTYAIVTNEVPKNLIAEADDVNRMNLEFPNFKKQKTNGARRKSKGKKGFGSRNMDCCVGPLAKVVWSRVVLDEAQTIKNYRTQVARACFRLRAKKRWCLSGTPVQNSIDDLYSYFCFLRYEPYNVYESFYTSIKVPIYKSSFNGYKKLQVILRSIMLRRTKETLINGVPIISLPPKSLCLKKVEFSEEEKAFYASLEAESRSKFKAFAAAGTLKQNYANILLMLLRLRQACDHPMLVKGCKSNSAENFSVQMVQNVPNDMVENLLSYLSSSTAICLVCNDPPEDSVISLCGHVFCYQCVSDYLIGDEDTCPAPGCKEHLDYDILFSEENLKNHGKAQNKAADFRAQFDEGQMIYQQDYHSSKLKAIIEILHASRIANEDLTKHPTKTIFFSQWTGMLDLVEHSLYNYAFSFRRLDGTMSLSARDRAVKDFNTDPEVTVMLMSLKAGNLGLNMASASQIVLLDLWWNPATEDQAVDRAHRIGQTRPVSVTRLTVKDTVEDRILALQEEKRKMVASAFGEDEGGSSSSHLTLEDLNYLFQC